MFWQSYGGDFGKAGAAAASHSPAPPLLSRGSSRVMPPPPSRDSSREASGSGKVQPTLPLHANVHPAKARPKEAAAANEVLTVDGAIICLSVFEVVILLINLVMFSSYLRSRIGYS